MNIEEIEKEQRALAKKQEELASKIEEIRNPKRDPRPGDVYQNEFGCAWVLGQINSMKILESKANKYRFNGGSPSCEDTYMWGTCTFLGTFDDVFIRRSEVREIFEWKDSSGDSIINGVLNDCEEPVLKDAPEHLKRRIIGICE